MYTVSFTDADRNNSSISESVDKSLQAEQIARIGISLAMMKMGSSFVTSSYTNQNASEINGSVVYSASEAGLPATQSQVIPPEHLQEKQLRLKRYSATTAIAGELSECMFLR